MSEIIEWNGLKLKELHTYPQIGDEIVISSSHPKFAVSTAHGKLIKVFRTRYGAVIGIIETISGKQVSYPHSRKYTKFYKVMR